MDGISQVEGVRKVLQVEGTSSYKGLRSLSSITTGTTKTTTITTSLGQAQAKHFTDTIPFNSKPLSDAKTSVSTVLQMRKPWFREVK